MDAASAWHVAIPTYQRPNTLVAKTMRTLLGGGVDPARITVFVANADEARGYALALAPGSYRQIVVGAHGIHSARNAITAHYPDGARVVEIDDDIRAVKRRVGPKELQPVGDLAHLFDAAFAACARHGARLWGLYPVCNPMFMRTGYTLDLRAIIGTVCGRVVDKTQPPLRCAVKVDIERTLLYWRADGRVLRYGDLAPVQNARTEPGGLQTPGGRTLAASEAAADYLVRTYPDLCVRAKPRKGGHAEVRLVQPKDPTP